MNEILNSSEQEALSLNFLSSIILRTNIYKTELDKLQLLELDYFATERGNNLQSGITHSSTTKDQSHNKPKRELYT